jgi:hypothetical protein
MMSDAPEEIGESVDPVSLNQCHRACGLGGESFLLHMCSKLDILRGAACVLAVTCSSEHVQG